MNARALYRRLRRGNVGAERHCLTVALPFALFPTAPPAFDAPGRPDCFKGSWKRYDPATGLTSLFVAGHFSRAVARRGSGDGGLLRVLSGDANPEPPDLSTLEPFPLDKLGATATVTAADYEPATRRLRYWYAAERRFRHYGTDRQEYAGAVDRPDLSEAYRARVLWEEAYLHGGAYREPGGFLLREDAPEWAYAVVGLTDWANNWQAGYDTGNRRVLYALSVKNYRNYPRRFASSVARALPAIPGGRVLRGNPNV